MASSVAAASIAGKQWWSNTRSIFCIGRNYLAHAKELNNHVPTKPFWFIKPVSSLVSSGDAHECPPNRSESHHEVELGIMIGERCRRVSAGDALKYVGGYFVALDMTDREGQSIAKAESKPWTASKGWDTSCPVSALIPASSVADYRSLNLWLRVNDDDTPKQLGSCSDMIVDLPNIISTISHYHTLEVGDMILTGTPSGVGPVVAGDVITAGCEELGLRISTPVVDGVKF